MAPDSKFALARDIDRYLAALSKLYAHEGERQLQEIIVNAQARVHEEWSYDNWDGGTFGHALYLALPESLFLVGKTTTTINIGVGLSQLGRSVILVDFDPQASLTQGLGVDPDSLPATIYDALIDEETPLDWIFLQTRTKIALAPAGIDLAGAEFELPAKPEWQQTLRRRLSSVKMKADFILIDCPTSLGVLTINALVAATEVLVPAECSFLAFRGLSGLLATIKGIQQRFNPRLRITAILPVKVPRTVHAREALEELRRICGPLVSDIIVPQRVKVADALISGQSILEFDPRSDAAEAFRRITEVIDHAQEGIHEGPRAGGRLRSL